MNKLKKIFKFFLIFFISTFVAGLFYKFHNVKERVGKLCEEIKPGYSLAKIKEFGLKHNMRFRYINESSAYLFDRRSDGRGACQLILKDKIVQSSDLALID